MNRKLPGIPDFMWEQIEDVNRKKQQRKLLKIAIVTFSGIVGLLAGFLFTIYTLGAYVFQTYAVTGGLVVIIGIGLVLCSMPEEKECRKFKNCKKEVK